MKDTMINNTNRLTPLVIPVFGSPLSSGPFVKSPMTVLFRYVFFQITNADVVKAMKLPEGTTLYATAMHQYRPEHDPDHRYYLEEMKLYAPVGHQQMGFVFGKFAGLVLKHWHELGIAATRRISDNDDEVGMLDHSETVKADQWLAGLSPEQLDQFNPYELELIKEGTK